MTELRFAPSHEWVRLDGDTATIGISAHAQEALGDIVFVDLPEPGREVEAGDAVAVVESVKAASDVYAPIAGRITETNAALTDDPATINRDPQGEGWFFRIAPKDASAVAALMDETAYAAHAEAGS